VRFSPRKSRSALRPPRFFIEAQASISAPSTENSWLCALTVATSLYDHKQRERTLPSS
jgi:hypothetical protein